MNDTKVTVLGFGLMGKQISALLYLCGLDICLWSRNPIEEKMFFRQVKILKKFLSNTMDGKVTFLDSILDIPNSIVIETIAEDLESKKELYGLIRKVNTNAYYSNTSSFSPNEIADDVNGIHFFNPINIGLIELYHKGSEVDPVMSGLLSSLEVFGFSIVRVNGNRGYIGNYILFHEISFAFKLIEQLDYSVDQVGKVYSKLYDKRDIFAIVDLIGIDVVNKILVNLKESDDSFYIPQSFNDAISKGILGRKNKTSIKAVL